MVSSSPALISGDLRTPQNIEGNGADGSLVDSSYNGAATNATNELSPSQDILKVSEQKKYVMPNGFHSLKTV